MAIGPGATASGWDRASGVPSPGPGGLQGGAFGAGANELLELAASLQKQGFPQQTIAQLLNSGQSADQIKSSLSGVGEFAPGSLNFSAEDQAQIAAANQQRQEQLAAQRAAEQQAAQRDAAINNRFGHDMAWLDPTFQRQATMAQPVTTQDALQYGTTADPAAQAAQRQAMERMFQLSQQGATADETAALDTQRGAIDRLLGVADQGATAEERSALDMQRQGVTGLYDAAARGATDVELEGQGAQRRAMDEMFGLYEQGGLSAQDRAARARARADTEGWLRGQREADMQNRAERGMSGSGSEILDLLADRQSAASRLSMSDLETSAAGEKRALEALMNAQGIGANLQSGEGQIASRALQALQAGQSGASSLAGNEGAIQQRGLNALGTAQQGAAGLADNYGSIEQRALDALFGGQRVAEGLQTSSDRFVQGNADMLQNANQWNANAINNAASANQAFLQNAYQAAMNNRNAWDMNVMNQQLGVATGTRGFDAGQNAQGWGQGEYLASNDTSRRNDANQNFNNAGISMFTGTTPAVVNTQIARNNAGAAENAAIGQAGVDAAGTFISAIAGGATGGGSMVGGMSGGQQQQQAPQQNQSLDPWMRK